MQLECQEHLQDKGRGRRFALALCRICLFFCTQSWAVPLKPSGPFSCCRAIERAARVTGVPQALLLCIARVESAGSATHNGHPWTVNAEGKSIYFANKQEAIIYINKLISQGISNIDVGVMQLNWKFHHQSFRNTEAMLDPFYNVLYAAQFLKRLRRRHGSWAKAVAAYHSRHPKRGQVYLMKAASHLTFKSSAVSGPRPLNHRAVHRASFAQPQQRNSR